MSAKLRRILIWASGGLCPVCLLLSWIFSPYSQSKYVFETSDPTAVIEIPVRNPIDITSVDQFVTAIENGYSNVRISDNVANPLLFMGDQLYLQADLVLDLNGHELQRTGRTPMIVVGEGITLTVYDSKSSDQNSLASMYNPVGSVINVNGGNLSLVSGKCESGVRATEYSTSEVSAHGAVNGTVSDATLYTKYETGVLLPDSELTDGYKAVESAILPKITAETITSGNYTLKDGNVYVPKGQTLTEETIYSFDSNNPLAEGGDYYLFYMNRDNAYATVSAGEADFYYQYTEGDEEITIYGYYKDFATAESDDATYAAILMESGNLNVFGGEYYQYFGVDGASCVYATGGTMTVHDGTYVAKSYSNCLDCNFGTEGSLDIKSGDFTSYFGDTIRVSNGIMTVTGGEFVKIADQSVSVGGGESKSAKEGYDSNGSAINLESGRLTVRGTGETSQSDLVKFTLYGGGVNGIKCGAGSNVICTNAEFLFNCDYNGDDQNSGNGSTLSQNDRSHNIGILNYAGDVTVENSLFRLNSAYNVGIYSTADELFTDKYGSNEADASASGNVTAISTMFSIKGERSIGVLATRGTVALGSEEHLDAVGEDRYAMFYIDHVYDCFGVYVAGINTSADAGTAERGLIDTTVSTGDKAVVNSIAAQFYLGQTAYKTENQADPSSYYVTGKSDARYFNSCGIYMNSTHSDSAVNIARTMIFAAGSYTAGIFVRSGQVVQSSEYKLASLMGVAVDKYLAGGRYDSNDTAEDHSAEGVGGHYRDKFGLTWYVAQYGAKNYTSAQLFDVSQAHAKACYGLSTLGGKISIKNCFVGIYSTWSSGIYSLGGDISLTGYDTSGDGKADSGFDCKVITFGASSTDGGASADADIGANTNLLNPYSYEGAVTGERLITSCVVRLGRNSSSSDGGRVYIAAGSVITDNYGFYIEGGNLYFGSEDSLSSTDIKSYRAPAIVVNGGNVELYNDDSLIITCTLNDETSFTYMDESGNTQTKSLGGWRDFTSAGEIPTDAIYISGGNFKADGSLNLTFTGLENDLSYGNFFAETIKSYAVRVVNGEFQVVGSMKIVNAIGGGVAVSGGKVQLGASDSTGTIDVTTTGTNVTAETYYDVSAFGTWQKYKNQNGGHAVMISGGDLTIYSGTYSAKNGNGIYVRETSSNYAALGSASAGTIISTVNVAIYDGEFTGNMSAYIGGVVSNRTGPGAYYGLKVIGNATISIYGGTYDGGNGGGFITGMNQIVDGGYLGGKAELYVYQGVFGSTETGANNAFNIYDGVTAYFGAYTEKDLQDKFGNDDYADNVADAIKCYSTARCIAVNPLYLSSAYRLPSEAYIYYGTYGIGSSSSLKEIAYVETGGGSAGNICVYNSEYNSIPEPLTKCNDVENRATISDQDAYRYYSSV